MTPDKAWKLVPSSSGAERLAEELDITRLQAQLLLNRGISDPEDAQSFMAPRLTRMADPMGMKGMAAAVEAVLRAIHRQDRITIYGDYDADGLTATAALSHFFSSLDIPVSFYIPHRLKQGYGLNREAVQEIAAEGGGLIITVDCGVGNSREIALAKEMGMAVVVTDHHQIPAGFQPGCPVVNPNQSDCPFPFKDLAGVGVAFFLMVALRAALREEGWFVSRPEPDLKAYLDLVALGTVADRAPLLDQNRMLVTAGMEVMAQSSWPGIRALMEVADISPSGITADDLAFRLGPRLNAPGRMGDAEMGLKVLMARQHHSASAFALEVHAANGRRQRMEREILDEIEEMLTAAKGAAPLRSLVLAGEDWHKGVLGIVASRLVDRHCRPTLVVSVHDGVAVGSGRSIDGFDLYEALSRFEHIFEKFGGHARAAGFTLKAANLDALRSALEGIAGEVLKDDDLIPTLYVDGEMSLREITPEIVYQIGALSPFGEGNRNPLFLARSAEVIDSWVVGTHHLKLRLKAGDRDLEAIGFGMSYKRPAGGERLDIVFTPEMNKWQGSERIQLRIADLSGTHGNSQ